MTETTRDARLLQTFAMLADTLVDDYDIVELLQSLVDACRDLLNTTAAGILLADGHGDLELVVSTSEASRLVEIMQLGAQAGPCIECYRTGAADLGAVDRGRPRRVGRVPRQRARSGLRLGRGASRCGCARRRSARSTCCVPSRARHPRSDMVAARAFADVATIGILHERSIRESEVLSQQLQLALNSRVVIEQAKGVVSFTNGVPVDEAFDLIRAYARSHQLPLSDVAGRLVRRELTLDS